MFLRWSPWHGRRYFLDKMTLKDLVWAYTTYPAIQCYALLAVVATVYVFYRADWSAQWGGLLLAALASIVIYPLIWYLLHRFVLHGRWLYKYPQTAALWKRIHYDHHTDPNDLGVLFGALYTTLPTIAMVTLPIGWLLAGPTGAAAAFASALITTCFYEFCHCIQHLPFTPRYAWLRTIKKRHLAHHFHNEQGNFGITNFLCDRWFGTYYESPKAIARSETVFDLGYRGQEVHKFPWVAEVSGLSLEEAALGGRRDRK